jgi:hypothetical protein
MYAVMHSLATAALFMMINLQLAFLLAAAKKLRQDLLPTEHLSVMRQQIDIIMGSKLVTVTVDCWESSQRRSIFGVNAITDEGRVLVVKLVDISTESHTGKLLAGMNVLKPCAKMTMCLKI